MLTFDQYKSALKNASPKFKENILLRAYQDQSISPADYKKLADLAYPGQENRVEPQKGMRWIP